MDKYTQRQKEKVKGMFALIPIIVLIAIVLMFFSCGLTKTVVKEKTLSSYYGEVRVLEKDMTLPDNAEYLGSIFVGDSGLTMNCSYSNVLSTTKKLAARMGGNTIQLLEHSTTGLIVPCHAIKATVYYVKPNQTDK